MRSMRAAAGILWTCLALAGATEDRRTLVFSREPPGRVHFLNETGAEVPCAARGATVRWETKEGTPLEAASGLRQVRPDGTLVFSPFGPDAYRPDVHAAVYRCTAASSAGKIGSRDVHVTGVLRQPYKVQVFDEYTVSGNTAVLRCNIPSFVKDYVSVTSWLRDDSRTIVAASETGGRYSVFPSGELHIRSAQLEDGFKSYRCVTRNRLSGEVSPSAIAGKLYVTDARSGVSPRITHSQPKVETRLGDSVEIPCAAQGYPVPAYAWFRLRDGSTRRVDVDGRTVERQGSLLIRGVTVHDGGTYLCLVNNSAGQERAHTELLVREPLQVVAVPRWQTVSSGSSALVFCNVSGHPQPSITWLKDLSPVSASVRLSGPLRRGVYQCFARNDKESAQDIAQIVLGEVAPVLRSAFEPSVLEPGSAVSLRCSAWGHPLPRITWSLDELPVPDHPRFSVGDYVTTAHPEVVSFVNVTALRVEDGGVYRCVASNDVGSSSHSAKVDVIGAPFVRPMGDVAAVQGEALMVRCPVAGYPVEEVYWEKEGRRIPFNHRQRAFKNGTFVIRDLDRRSDPGEYTCTARNSQGEKGERTLRITVLTPPVIEPFHFPPAIEEGSRSKILCSVTRGDPPLTVSWLKDGRPLKDEDEDISLTTLDEFSSAILFRRVRLDHRGDYMCVARNTAAQDTFTATMVVHAPPRWLVEPSPTEAVLGSDMTLDCVADGFPKPHVAWKRARDALASDYDALPSDGHVQLLLNGSLSIRGLQKSDSGSYMCQANNGIGAGIGTLITLKVRVPAHFREEFVAETVRKGAELVVRCRAFGDRPMAVTWKKDGQFLDQQAEKKYSVEEAATGEDGLTSSIRIESADRRDSSLFTCLARNAFGRDEMNIQIIVQERPDKPFKVTSSERTSRSVSLSWSPPYSGNSPILAYTVQYKQTTSGSWQEDSKELTTSGVDSKLLVGGLQPATSYHFRVMAENAFGKSDYSAPVTADTDLEVPGGPPLNVQAEAVGSHTLRVTWQPPPTEVHNGPLSGYYVGYKARGTGQPYTYKTLEASGHECLVTGLRPLTSYHVIVQAFNDKGAGPPSQEIEAHTTDNDPPTHPVLSMKSVTHTSIQVEWEVTSTPIQGFQLHYKREMGGWQDLSMDRDRRDHLFEGLDCGTRYHFFVTAFNEAGQGLPSEPLAAKTLGVAPVAPPQSRFVRPNATAALLQMSEWRDGGCPVSFFVVQYREEEGGGDWLLASDRLPPPRDERPFELQGLRPRTRYRLHVAAHSDAGVTHAQYAFDTDPLGDDEKTESVVVSLYTNLAIVTPVVVTAVILVSVLTVVCALGKKRRTPDDDCGGVRKMEGSVALSEYEVKPDLSQSKQYLPSPYATSRVPVYSVAEDDPDRPYDLPFAARKGADTKHAKEALKHEHMYSFQRGSRRSMHPEGPFLYPEQVT